jgi:hypothetical protein
MSIDQWKPWIEIVEAKSTEDITEEIMPLVPEKYIKLVALALSVAKWHPGRRKIAEARGSGVPWGETDLLNLYDSLDNDDILCTHYIATLLTKKCKECPLYDKKRNADCFGWAQPYRKYMDADYTEDREEYANLVHKQLLKAYKKELRKFPELTKNQRS